LECSDLWHIVAQKNLVHRWRFSDFGFMEIGVGEGKGNNKGSMVPIYLLKPSNISRSF